MFDFSIIVNFTIPFLLGGLIFFSLLIAPTVFISLDEKSARKFLRNLFPKIYLFAGTISIFISAFLFSINNFLSFVFIIVTLGYFFSRQFLMPKINEASDKKNVSDFKKLHRFSVVIFMIQIIIMILVYTQI